MMQYNDFACFILTHGRANNVKTYKTLRERGYTGKIYIVIDNEDDQEEEYRKNFGEQVLVFDKDKYFEESDTRDAGGSRAVILPARNFCFDAAVDLHLQYFLELDDDYHEFMFRYEDGGKLRKADITDLDRIFDIYLEFLDNSGAITVAFAQGGDFIGGLGSSMWTKRIMRKGMNAFFCKTLRPFKFMGRINEDVNTYTTLGNQGKLIFTVADVMLSQGATQQNEGGMTSTYIDHGTYHKSFYSVIGCPSGVKIGIVGNNDYRIHHNVSWDYVTPKIINKKYRK